MSNSYFEMIIQSDDYEFIKNEVLKNDVDGKSEDFLEKLRYNTNKINQNNIKLFFRLLYDIGDKLNVETGSFLFSKNTLLFLVILVFAFSCCLVLFTFSIKTIASDILLCSISITPP